MARVTAVMAVLLLPHRTRAVLQWLRVRRLTFQARQDISLSRIWRLWPPAQQDFPLLALPVKMLDHSWDAFAARSSTLAASLPAHLFRCSNLQNNSPIVLASSCWERGVHRANSS